MRAVIYALRSEPARESIRRALRPDLERVQATVRHHSQYILDMAVELFGTFAVTDDEEWSEADEVARDWQLWGEPGSGFKHLPVMREEEMYRRSWGPTEPAGLRGVYTGPFGELSSANKSYESVFSAQSTGGEYEEESEEGEDDEGEDEEDEEEEGEGGGVVDEEMGSDEEEVEDEGGEE